MHVASVFLRFTSQNGCLLGDCRCVCSESVATLHQPVRRRKDDEYSSLKWCFFSPQGCEKRQAVTRKLFFTFVEPVSDAVEDDPFLP